LPEREFSEEHQAVAMKRESQLLFRIHLLFALFSTFFHDYSDSGVTTNLSGNNRTVPLT
jgi:hypothetical protein